MKKFTFKGVLDGFRSTVQPPSRGADQEIQETLRPEHFQLKKTFRHGFPFTPTAIAWDPIQKLLAVGDKSGSLRILGRPGVDAHVRHDGEAAGVTHVAFLVNEGALVTATADDSLHLWNFRQKSPQVVHTLKFTREKITCLHLPLQSKWLHVGTERGNVHVVHIETFVLSGYIINWNKAIEPVRATHPGAVVQISDNPLDASKLLIAFESGQMAIWDLRTRMADFRCISPEPLRSVVWHQEGKQFMSCHTDGSLCTWTIRTPPKPLTISYPHAKTNKDGKLESCKPIQKVEWKTSKAGESYVIFSGGLPFDKAGRTPSITVINGKAITVLEMEHNVVDFITLCDSPWSGDMQDPYAIVVLLQNDLVVIDLQTPGYPCFENPYPMDLHESPVTCCAYFADCPSDLIPAFYSVGRQCSQKRVGFSEREWPVNGGEWSPASCSYNEIILTGHADGSIKFWDASAGTLQILYKLKTAKVFEKPRSRSVDGTEEDPLSIQLISLCPESRKMAVAGAGGHVIFFKFRKTESSSETHVLEIPLNCDVPEDTETSPDCEFVPSHRHSVSQDLEKKVWCSPQLRVKGGNAVRKAAGFQAALVCLPPAPPRPPDPAQPQQFNITALTINSSYGLMAFGNDHGLVIVDVVRRVIVWSASSAELYGSQDPYCRSPRRACPDPPMAVHPEAPTSPSIDQAQPQDKIVEYTETDQAATCSSNTAQVPLGSIQGSVLSSHLEGTVEIADEAYIQLSPNSKREISAAIAIQQTTSQFAPSHAGSLPITEMTETYDSLNLTAEEKHKIEAAQNRRKSTTWKNFKLKRQFSKVDMKLKNPFSVAQEKKETEPKEANPKKSSVFYFPNTEGSSLSPVDNEGESPVSQSAPMKEEPNERAKSDSDVTPDPDSDVTSNVERFTAVGSEGTDPVHIEKKSLNMYDRMHQELRETWKTEIPIEESSKASLPDDKEAGNKSTRPDNLPLFDEDGKPVRPPRQYKKSKSLIGDKRDQRLLSVPNIKYIRQENVLKDLRRKDGSAQSQPSFAGNLMRRFRKCMCRLCRARRRNKKSSRKKSEPTIKLKYIDRNHIIDKLDSSFSRSRSSSMSSLENISTEAVQCLAFADSYTKKSDPSALLPTLWVGTSLGSVLTVMINLPEPDVRHAQPVVVSILGGPIFRLKGSILTMSFLDCNGALIPYAYEPWRDENKEGREKRERTPTKQGGSSGPNSRMSPTPGASCSADAALCSDRQFVVIASEKQARVVALPSQNCVYRQQLVDTDFVVKAEIVSMKDSVCLVCYFSSGHLFAYSLPSLRPLIDINFLPLSELSFQTQCNNQGGIVDPMLSIWGQQLIVNEDTDQIARTFCFSNRGHGLYLSSPSEVQKFTIDIEFCQAVNEMMGELFLPHDMPEPPKESFFRGLFGGGARPLDREELFGEGSGKPSRTVAKHVPGPTANVEALNTRASTATSEIARAHMMVVERGEKLGQLEDRTERMASNAQEFGSTAHQLMMKYKDKKWYQL